MKKSLIVAVSLAGLVIAGQASASPYSSWENERESRHNNITVYTADVTSLPYDKIVDRAYTDKGNQADILQMQIARSFETGKFEVPVNADEAARWYNNAALNGNPHAAWKVYEYSRGKSADAQKKGKAWLEFAAERNHVDAVYRIGQYKFKDINMSEQELVEAREYFERAHRLGHPDGKVQSDIITRELRKRDNSKRWKEFWSPFKAE